MSFAWRVRIAVLGASTVVAAALIVFLVTNGGGSRNSLRLSAGDVAFAGWSANVLNLDGGFGRTPLPMSSESSILVALGSVSHPEASVELAPPRGRSWHLGMYSLLTSKAVDIELGVPSMTVVAPSAGSRVCGRLRHGRLAITKLAITKVDIPLAPGLVREMAGQFYERCTNGDFHGSFDIKP